MLSFMLAFRRRPRQFRLQLGTKKRMIGRDPRSLWHCCREAVPIGVVRPSLSPSPPRHPSTSVCRFSFIAQPFPSLIPGSHAHAHSVLPAHYLARCKCVRVPGIVCCCASAVPSLWPRDPTVRSIAVAASVLLLFLPVVLIQCSYESTQMASYGAAGPSGGNQATVSTTNREKLLALPTRSYLDETVVPVMMQALAAVARDRPEDPIDYVAHFLLKHNPKRLNDATKGF